MCWGEGGGVEGIGLVKKLKWDLVTIRIRKYDLKWSKIVTLKDQKVQWGAHLFQMELRWQIRGKCGRS